MRSPGLTQIRLSAEFVFGYRLYRTQTEDGSSSDNYHKWTAKRQFYLGAHLMNNFNYKNTGAEVQFNCVVQPLFKVVTSKNISKGAELYIGYNQ